VLDDTLTEGDETVTLTASSTDQVITAGDSGTGTIEDDRGSDNPQVDEDTSASIQVSDAGTVTEADGNYLTYSVSLSNPVGHDITASLALGGNATQGADYGNLEVKDANGNWVALSGSDITLPADGSAVEVRVPVLDDTLTEGDETVTLTASSTDQVITAGDSGTGTIEDNDPNTVIANDDGLNGSALGEFTIPAFESGHGQSAPDVAALKDGGYVVAWTEVSGDSYQGADTNDINDDGDLDDPNEITWSTKENTDVFIQRYDLNGDPVGDPVRVNTLVTDVNEDGGRAQHDVHVIGLENGNFLVTWTSDDQYIEEDNWDNGSRYIQGQIFDSNGEPICDEFTVARAEYDPIVATPDGGFVVTWSADARLDNTDHGAIDNPIYSDTHDGSGFGVVAQRFDAYGNELGDRVVVNSMTQGDQIDSDITMLDNQHAIMTWQSINQDGDGYGIYAQELELTADGLVKTGNEIQVNATTAGNQTDPEVTALSNGNAVITWESEAQGVVARIILSDGSMGNEIVIGAGENPVITAVDHGFVVAWESGDDIHVQAFDEQGNAVSGASTITGAASIEHEPAIVTLPDGGYVVTYESGDGIKGQRFDADGTPFHQAEYIVNEDSSITIDVADLLANDVDPDGHSFTITSVQNPQHGTVTLSADHTQVTFTPDADYNGPATFDYTIQDQPGNGLTPATDSATVHLVVRPESDPTIMVGTTCDADIHGPNVTVNEGETVVFGVRVSGAEPNSTVTLQLQDGTAVDADYNEQFFQYSLDGGQTWSTVNGPIAIPEGLSTLLVKTDTVDDQLVEGDETFKLEAVLSTGESAVGTATVIDDDSVPISTDDQISTLEDTSVTLSVSDFGDYSDADGDAMQAVKIVSLPANGSLLLDGQAITAGQEISVSDIQAGKLQFAPTHNTDADSGFNFQVSDGVNWSETYTTSVEVIAVADAPEVNVQVGSVQGEPDYSAFAFNGDNYYKHNINQGCADLKLNSLNETAISTPYGLGVQNNPNESEQGLDDNETLVIQLANPAEEVTFNLNTAGQSGIEGAYVLFDTDGNQISSLTDFTLNSDQTITLSAPQGETIGYVAFDAHNQQGGANDHGFFVEPVSYKPVINTENIETQNDVKVQAFHADGTASEISYHSNPDGFGVKGAASGADSEIGYQDGVGSEKLVLSFDELQSSVDVSFAWKHSVGQGETATYTFYKDGQIVGSGSHTGGSDAVDPPIMLQPDNGQPFDQIVFGAQGTGDDYLIHSLSYHSVMSNTYEYPVTLNAALTDTDGSESLSVLISGVPDGATLSTDDSSVTLSANQDGTWTVTPNNGTTSIDNLQLTLSVPAEASDFVLEAKATATESENSDTSINVDYAAVDMASDTGSNAGSGSGSGSGSHSVHQSSGSGNIDILYAASDEGAHIYSIEAVTVGSGQNAHQASYMITDFDETQDVLDISEVIDNGEVIDKESLSEYLQFETVDADGDGQVDDTKITIDSNGESDAGGTLVDVYIQDTTLDENDLDDLKVDYQDQ
jgi:hypothetical protein